MAWWISKTLAETTKLLEEKSNTKAKELEAHLNNTLNATLKNFQRTPLREVATMILTQIERQINKTNVSIDKAVSTTIHTGQNQNYTAPKDTFLHINS